MCLFLALFALVSRWSGSPDSTLVWSFTLHGFWFVALAISRLVLMDLVLLWRRMRSNPLFFYFVMFDLLEIVMSFLCFMCTLAVPFLLVGDFSFWSATLPYCALLLLCLIRGHCCFVLDLSHSPSCSGLFGVSVSGANTFLLWTECPLVLFVCSPSCTWVFVGPASGESRSLCCSCGNKYI